MLKRSLKEDEVKAMRYVAKFMINFVKDISGAGFPGKLSAESGSV